MCVGRRGEGEVGRVGWGWEKGSGVGGGKCAGKVVEPFFHRSVLNRVCSQVRPRDDRISNHSHERLPIPLACFATSPDGLPLQWCACCARDEGTGAKLSLQQSTESDRRCAEMSQAR